MQRYRTIATQPPRCNNFSETVTQWYIYDAYMTEIENNSEKKTDKEKKGPAALDLEPKKKASESDPIYSDAMKLSESDFRV